MNPLLLLSAAAGLAWLAAPWRAAALRPDVLFILVDDPGFNPRAITESDPES